MMAIWSLLRRATTPVVGGLSPHTPGATPPTRKIYASGGCTPHANDALCHGTLIAPARVVPQVGTGCALARVVPAIGIMIAVS